MAGRAGYGWVEEPGTGGWRNRVLVAVGAGNRWLKEPGTGGERRRVLAAGGACLGRGEFVGHGDCDGQ